MCGLSTVVTPAGASLTMYREIRSYANSIWDDNNNNNNCTVLALKNNLDFTARYFETGKKNESETVVDVVVFFTLTDRASTIPNNTRGCQSGTWSAGQKKIRGTSTKLQ